MFHRKTIIALTLGLTLSTTAWAGPWQESNFKFPQPDFRLSTPSSAYPMLVVADASTDDLGFSKEETESDPKFQRDLDTRTDMLKIHQTLGLITCVPMVTTYVLGFTAAKNDLMLHGAFGFSTAGLYLTTASFAIFAPHIKDMKSTGNSDLHQVFAILHGVFMVATPILGEMAEENKSLVDVHFISATGLVASYLAAMSVMTF